MQIPQVRRNGAAPLIPAEESVEPPDRIAEPTGPSRDALRLVSLALLAWSMLYALPHLYWGLGGEFGFFALKPSATEIRGWEAANLFAFALIAFAGLLGLALERAMYSPFPRALLLTVSGLGAAIAGAHGAFGIVFRTVTVAGAIDVDGEPFSLGKHEWVLWDLLAIEPWFLIEGLLLGVVGYTALSSRLGQERWVRLVGAASLVAFATGAVGLRVG